MPSTEISAGGVVYCRNAGTLYILLIADARGRWSFPKGLVQHHESPEQAGLREIAEETGVHGRIEAPLGTSQYVYRRAGGLVNKTVHFFLVAAHIVTAERVGEPTPAASDGTPILPSLRPQLSEVSDARWFPAATALTVSAFPANTVLLRQALATLAEPLSSPT